EMHAANCPECGEEVRIWKSMSDAAGEMRHEWETPYLWTRIERALTEQMAEKPSRLGTWLNALGIAGFSRQTAAALALLIIVTGTATWIGIRKPQGPTSQVFLQQKAVNEVERAEVEYQKAIDRLDAQARPQLEAPATPLMASYREKLFVLDNAIEELREEAGRNPANAHLRGQLLAMYQEKRKTLEEVLEMKR